MRLRRIFLTEARSERTVAPSPARLPKSWNDYRKQVGKAAKEVGATDIADYALDLDDMSMMIANLHSAWESIEYDLEDMRSSGESEDDMRMVIGEYTHSAILGMYSTLSDKWNYGPGDQPVDPGRGVAEKHAEQIAKKFDPYFEKY